jgi:hypothetical protein
MDRLTAIRVHHIEQRLQDEREVLSAAIAATGGAAEALRRTLGLPSVGTLYRALERHPELRAKVRTLDQYNESVCSAIRDREKDYSQKRKALRGSKKVIRRAKPKMAVHGATRDGE